MKTPISSLFAGLAVALALGGAAEAVENQPSKRAERRPPLEFKLPFFKLGRDAAKDASRAEDRTRADTLGRGASNERNRGARGGMPRKDGAAGAMLE